MYLILELEDCGSSLEGKDLKPYENQIIAVFDRLHHIGIIHNDVAKRNLLVDENGQVLVCDFDNAEMRAEGTTEEEWSQKALEDDEMVDMLFQAGEQEILIDE